MTINNPHALGGLQRLDMRNGLGASRRDVSTCAVDAATRFEEYCAGGNVVPEDRWR